MAYRKVEILHILQDQKVSHIGGMAVSVDEFEIVSKGQTTLCASPAPLVQLQDDFKAVLKDRMIDGSHFYTSRMHTAAAGGAIVIIQYFFY